LATIALHQSEAIYGLARRVAQKNLAILDQFFSENEELFRWVRPRGGMTGFPWLANGGVARELCTQLANRGLLLAPGDCFGMPSHFRIGFGTTADRFPEAVTRLAEFVQSARELCISPR